MEPHRIVLVVDRWHLVVYRSAQYCLALVREIMDAHLRQCLEPSSSRVCWGSDFRCVAEQLVYLSDNVVCGQVLLASVVLYSSVSHAWSWISSMRRTSSRVR